MNALELIITGGLLGVVGQFIRAIVGAKKLRERAAAKGGKSFASEFSPSEFLFSLAIGFTAGVVVIVGIYASETEPLLLDKLSVKIMLAIMAAGYAGADFIEGFAKNHLPNA